MLPVLFLTLEYSSGTFSGNGIYAQSQVRALRSLGHAVLVISGKPMDSKSSETSNDHLGSDHRIEVPVSRWGRLDASAPYEEFAEGGSSPQIISYVASFSPAVVMVVDWSALELYRRLKQRVRDSKDFSLAPMVYLNYRVFSRTAIGDELNLVSRLELEALQEAALTVALSRSDAAFLTEMRAAAFQGDMGHCPSPAGTSGMEVQVLLCALREDMRKLPVSLPSLDSNGVMISEPHISAVEDFVRSRTYLTCCVRLSPEKEPHRFVSLVEELARRGMFQQNGRGNPGSGLIPLLVGSSNDDYSQGLKRRLKAAVPESLVLESFMGPEALAGVFSKTLLNFHPATYDAFGMTIVEAASQGAPSLCHDADGSVGATDLLRADLDEVILADLTGNVEQLADRVQLVLADPAALLRVARKASNRARSWSEEANAAKLVSLVQETLKTKPIA